MNARREGRRMLRAILVVVALLVLGGFALLVAAGRGVFGSHEDPGQVTASARPPAEVHDEELRVAQAAREIGLRAPKQVLFGDLHVHTTFSFDAFMFSLPVAGGEGARPPADACDFARYCSALDFWSINDHAFSITPRHWRETVDSIRQCNDVAGDPANPDTVAFLGWEWTQVGLTPETHYGHKNVVLHYTDDAHIPERPVAARRGIFDIPPAWQRGIGALLGGGRVNDLARYWQEWADTPLCDPELPADEVRGDCIDAVDTSEALFRRLDEWGYESIVIPHGTTWGFYTPPGSTWDKQLAGAAHDPARQTLLEVYSGHGDSEVYRDFRAVDFDANGNPVCPRPSSDYLPSCWRAGEIIRQRCLADGEADDECERRAAEARSDAAVAGVAGHLTVPGSVVEDWLDSGQCRDCREPAFNYRPGGSAQYILALGNFDLPGSPRRFRMGFIASSDNHFARPGTGYKERFRRGMTESQRPDPDAGLLTRVVIPARGEVASESRPFQLERAGFRVFEVERQASFLTTGGLVAVHAEGRDRDAIWRALQRREVYGTTGPRILLWFDLLNPPGSTAGASRPMGSVVTLAANPIFQVRAVGSFEQRPGCPDSAARALGAERLEDLCKGECYHPGERRRLVTRIEVVRVRPQIHPGEDIAGLVDDPFRTFACDPDPAGCVVTFTDPDFVSGGRDTVYYARAFEEPKPAINAGNLRCVYDENGNCVELHPCPGPAGRDDDCLAPQEPRAWSSPIYVDQAHGSARVAR
jgi:hypothetical protein